MKYVVFIRENEMSRKFIWGAKWWNTTLQWRHNERDGVSDHQPNRLFRRRSKETSKPRVTGPCVGDSPVIGEFPAQMSSNAEFFFHLMTSSWIRTYRMVPGLCRRMRLLIDEQVGVRSEEWGPLQSPNLQPQRSNAAGRGEFEGMEGSVDEIIVEQYEGNVLWVT